MLSSNNTNNEEIQHVQVPPTIDQLGNPKISYIQLEHHGETTDQTVDIRGINHHKMYSTEYCSKYLETKLDVWTKEMT